MRLAPCSRVLVMETSLRSRLQVTCPGESRGRLRLVIESAACPVRVRILPGPSRVYSRHFGYGLLRGDVCYLRLREPDEHRPQLLARQRPPCGARADIVTHPRGEQALLTLPQRRHHVLRDGAAPSVGETFDRPAVPREVVQEELVSVL